MDRRLLTRGIKTLVSVISLIALLLLVALWVRSYHTEDILCCPGGKLAIVSKRSTITLSSSDVAVVAPGWQSVPTDGFMSIWPAWYAPFINNPVVRFPHRLIVAILIMGAAAPWIRRFSLRTLHSDDCNSGVARVTGPLK
jgi:hypothetical protein